MPLDPPARSASPADPGLSAPSPSEPGGETVWRQTFLAQFANPHDREALEVFGNLLYTVTFGAGYLGDRKRLFATDELDAVADARPAGDDNGGGGRGGVTPAGAQGELRAVADQLLAVEDRLRRVWLAAPRSPDEDAMFEGRQAWNLATEIRTVVECVGEGQRLDLMLQRVDVASRQVGSLEGELSGLRSRRTSLVDERFAMQARLEAMAAEVDASDPESLPVYEAMARQAERGLKHFGVRLVEVDGRILELENELVRRRGDLQALQDRLDRELDGLE